MPCNFITTRNTTTNEMSHCLAKEGLGNRMECAAGYILQAQSDWRNGAVSRRIA